MGIAIKSVEKFLQGRRQLYCAPTAEQIDRFWFEVVLALTPLLNTGVYKKNETEHYIEKPGTEERIKAKTVWNAETLRGDYADDLYLDEWQLMDEDTWGVVGAPMLLDNNGDATFIYTPPSLRSAGVSKARDPRHASKLFKKASEDKTGRWQTFHFTSHDNPHISRDALHELIQDMSKKSYRQEILAEDDELQLTWLVYGVYKEQTQKIPRFEIPFNWPVYVGHDFGGANPAALFFAKDPATGFFYVFREYLPGSGRSTADHVEAFKEIVALPGQGDVEEPKTYNVMMRAGGSHQEDEVRQGYAAHGWYIQEPALHRVAPQIDKVVGIMELNRLFVFDDLIDYPEELMNCLWERDTDGMITNVIENEKRYHLCACARYCLSEFTPETIVPAGKQKAVSYI